MSKKILFIYFTLKQKHELKLCEKVFKATFRKFRESVLFSYMGVDTSPSCRDSFGEMLFNKIQCHDAVLIGGKGASSEEEILTKEILELSATENHLGGNVICYGASHTVTENKDGFVTQTHKTSIENFRSASKAGLELAKRHKHHLVICTDNESKADKPLSEELLSLSGKELHIQSEHISFDEIISLCMGTIMSFGVILTTEQYAKIIAIHLNSQRKAPSGHLLLHTTNGHIYQRQVCAYEEMSNAPLASLLMAFSALIENEFSMNSAADWLRKAVLTVFETHAVTPRDEFLEKIISEIEKPMRNRKREIK